MSKVAFLIDGWFMRKRIYKLKSFFYNGQNIRKYCCEHLRPNDQIYRIFYYDALPLDRRGTHPLTGEHIDFSEEPVAVQQRALFDSLRRTPNFALRLGKTVWNENNWGVRSNTLNGLLNQEITVEDLKPYDVYPQFEQKAVDVKIGMDIACLALKRLVDMLIVISGDSDLVPSMKLARIEGLQVGLDPLWSPISDDLAEHVDFISTKLETPSSQQVDHDNLYNV